MSLMTHRLFGIGLAIASGIAVVPILSAPVRADAGRTACDVVLTCSIARSIEKCGTDAECHHREAENRNRRLRNFFK